MEEKIYKFHLDLRISTVSKKGGAISAQSGEVDITSKDNPIDTKSPLLIMKLALHFQPYLKRSICLVEVLEAKLID